jgi:hypothetical protein
MMRSFLWCLAKAKVVVIAETPVRAEDSSGKPQNDRSTDHPLAKAA